MNKEEQRRLEARRKRSRARRAKATIIGSVTVIIPLLFFLITQR